MKTVNMCTGQNNRLDTSKKIQLRPLKEDTEAFVNKLPGDTHLFFYSAMKYSVNGHSVKSASLQSACLLSPAFFGAYRGNH
mmetsp:Transcript_25119/g.33298  ORF Transcript_25119/g.33298 Transcript_25119/m.33298 type:complete len:81 (-) Transcript_25119:836-1078(-)